MDSEKPPPVLLSSPERWLAGLIGSLLVVLSVVVFYFPPRRTTAEYQGYDITAKTTADADSATVVIAVFTAGLALLAYAINRIRIRRMAGAGLEFDGNPVEGTAASQLETSNGVKAGAAQGAPDAGPGDNIPTFQALTEEEKQIIATLWRVQHDYKNRPYNWGFTIPPSSNEHLWFWRGLSTLLQRRLVFADANGLVALTERGVEHCRLNSAEILVHPKAWTKFEPLVAR
ncbi:MAG: hypothetical protein HYV95_17055 [Opitutae bacterium]|nr:hypothetical protein [Opitutae bacterium]